MTTTFKLTGSLAIGDQIVVIFPDPDANLLSDINLPRPIMRRVSDNLEFKLPVLQETLGHQLQMVHELLFGLIDAILQSRCGIELCFEDARDRNNSSLDLITQAFASCPTDQPVHRRLDVEMCEPQLHRLHTLHFTVRTA